MIARTPAVKYFLRQNEHVTVNLWCPEYFIELAEQFYLDQVDVGRLKIRHIEQYSAECNWDEPNFSFSHPQHTSFATNLTQHAFNLLVNQEIPAKERREYYNYPRLRLKPRLDLDLPYVVLTTNYTAPARAMREETISELLDYFQSRGTKVILLGKSSTKVHEKKNRTIESFASHFELRDNVKDLRDQTTLLEAASLMHYASAVIGIDNGLLHLAACTDAPIIAGFTSVSPKHRQIYRGGELNKGIYLVTPDEALPCKFCQSNMGLVYGHRFKYCYYDDYLCTQQITAEKIINIYEGYLT